MGTVVIAGRSWPVAADGGCLIWVGKRAGDGRTMYGLLSSARRRPDGTWTANIYAHRAVLEERLGHPIPAGLTASHLCGRSLCVNRDHLIAETHRENCARRRSGYIDPAADYAPGELMELWGR